MSVFTEFSRIARSFAPQTAIVLGSGLGGVTAGFSEVATVSFADVPGLVQTTVQGHHGRIAVGHWHGTPTLLFLGRLHFYEGHSQDAVTAPIRRAADLGVKRLILTNAAGGIHPSLNPGSLMAICGHIKLIGPNAWRTLAVGTAVKMPYSSRLLERMCLLAGVYAALTGPCYETPAEIRAYAASGVDAVGMSTALEAEAAAELGMEVAAISCITNKAAGLSAAPLDHTEVLVNAKLAVDQLAALLGELIK
ncbi:MAG: purine-nucleoside phosphorylase [Planctomycetes bacterium]|nr:purine-nucleoside phosphorylase [Planctomycetota bacterium]